VHRARQLGGGHVRFRVWRNVTRISGYG
jgi:hypothetical protein